MFHNNCIILKDSLELRGILADIGYKMQLDANAKYAALLATKKAVIGLPSEDYYSDGTRWTLEAFIRGNPQFYNCGENEKLFIALAAISDTYPMLYRWMINNKTGEWIQRTPDAKFSELEKCRLASAEDVILKFEGWNHEG
jgi:hypothetical protein